MTTLDRRVAPWANLRVDGHDGTALAIDVHLPPPTAWPVPTVITRTPYGRSRHLAEGQGWRQRGIAYVAADVRGRYDSDGTWEPYRNERADGAALADWVLAQPWCDGRLVPYGGSYAGYTAWALAVERPDHVAAVVSLGPSMSLSRTKFDPSGVLRLGEHAAWWLERAEARTSRDGLARTVFAENPALLDHLPVIELGSRLAARLPHWTDLLTADSGEPIHDHELAALPAASLHVGGWYDLLLPESLHHWEIVGQRAEPRPSRRLVIGPWDHDLAFGPGTTVGDRDHGPRGRMPFDRLALRWLGRVLAGERPPDATEVFVLGADDWVNAPDWPGVSEETVLNAGPYGTLDASVPLDSGTVQFRYDPLDPFPSRHPGRDRSDTRRRTDAARFATEPLTAPLTIWGRATLDLVATTDAASVDWTARLLDLRPDGRRFELARGVAVDGGSRRVIELSAAASTVPAGASLGLEITASDFPGLARNLGTGADRYRSTATRVSTQLVHWGKGSTSVRLPIRPGGPS